MAVNIAPHMVATVGAARFAALFILIENMQRRPKRLELLFAECRFAPLKAEVICSESRGIGYGF